MGAWGGRTRGPTSPLYDGSRVLASVWSHVFWNTPWTMDPTPPTTTAATRTTLTAQVAPSVRRFLATEAGSAALLVLASVVALLWANLGGSSYEDFWHVKAAFSLGDWQLALDLRHWLDEGAMAVFFFVIGLEVRREASMGELTDRRRVALPVLGGIGGMLVPVLCFLALVPSGDAADGWGIVLATDTAFLLGALALVGPRLSSQLRIFLLTLSIVDDLVAISVIGIAYSDEVHTGALVVAGALLVVLSLLGRFGIASVTPYLALAGATWFATLEAGLHPTIAGMAAGLAVTAYPPRRGDVERAAQLGRLFGQSPMPHVARATTRLVAQAISPNERLLQALHPWTAYAVVPLFALANAGVVVGDGAFGEAIRSPLTWSIIVGLVVGKLVGISLATLLPRRAGLGALPVGVGPGHVFGGAALSGIGFTVSLLIAQLAYDDPTLQRDAKLGILVAAVVSVVVGWVAFALAARLRGERDATLPVRLATPVDPDHDRVRGRADAPMVLVEYGDFECSFCSSATGTIEEIRAELGDDVAYVFRHLPLDDVHPHAVRASAAAEAAGRQGRFWEMHDLLFERYEALEDDDLVRYAEQLGLDVDRFTDDIDDPAIGRRVRSDVAGAEASGARGTPTFFVNGVRHTTAYDAASLVAALRRTAGGTAPGRDEGPDARGVGPLDP